MDSNTNKVLASRIETITLYNKKLTTGRRSSPIPQLKCVGGSARGHHEVDTMRCRAQGQGYDTNDIQWTCTANTGPYFKLGGTQVLCEGYDHPDDPYILKGSCGVEYRLMLTEQGEAKFTARKDKIEQTTSGDSSGLAAGIFALMFLVVASIIFYKMFESWQRNRDQDLARRPIHLQNGDHNDDDDDDDSDHNNGNYDNHLDERQDTSDDPPPPYSDDDADFKGGGNGSSLNRGLAYGAGVATGAGISIAAARAYSRRTGAQETNEDDSEPGISGSSISGPSGTKRPQGQTNSKTGKNLDHQAEPQQGNHEQRAIQEVEASYQRRQRDIQRQQEALMHQQQALQQRQRRMQEQQASQDSMRTVSSQRHARRPSFSSPSEESTGFGGTTRR